MCGGYNSIEILGFLLISSPCVNFNYKKNSIGSPSRNFLKNYKIYQEDGKQYFGIIEMIFEGLEEMFNTLFGV